MQCGESNRGTETGSGENEKTGINDKKFNIRDYLKTENLTDKQIDYCEFWVSAYRKVRDSGKPNFEGEQIIVNDNWNFDYLEEKLSDYHDREVIKYFKYGWPLNAQDTEIREEVPKNQAGVKENREEVRKYLQEEIDRGSVIGPFHTNPFGNEARFSPLDTRAKKDSEEVRIILNLSYPFEKGSVNASIDKEQYMGEEMTLKYPTPDDLAKIILKKGKGCKVFIRDLKKAYRQLFLDPRDLVKVGYVFENKIYFDVCLSMGSKSSAYCCQRTTNCVTHINKKEGFDNVNYLDDLGGAEESKKADNAYQFLGEILKRIGILESESKAKPPSQIAIFLGILYNTVGMTMELTEERLRELNNLLEIWSKKNTATLKEIQQIVGKLNFACSTVRTGRVFISKMINMMKEFPQSGRRRLTEDFKKDLSWWKTYMKEFDGINIIPDFEWSKPDEKIATDSCLTGCGGWMNGRFFHMQFPKWLTRHKEVSINELETMAIIVALKLWGTELKNSHLLLFCDNSATVNIINTGRAKNLFAQNCLREICYLNAKNNMVVKVVHKAGCENRLPDLLSRWGSSSWYSKQFHEETKEIETKEETVSGEMFKFTHEW